MDFLLFVSWWLAAASMGCAVQACRYARRAEAAATRSAEAAARARYGVQEDRAHLLALAAAVHPAVLLTDPAGEQPPVLSLTIDGHVTLWIIAPHEAALFDHVRQAHSEIGVSDVWADYRHDDKLAAIRRVLHASTKEI